MANSAAQKLSRDEIETALSQFTGSSSFYRHFTNHLVYTEGVHFLAEAAGAYWLIDLIASYQPLAAEDSALREFQLWQLEVHGTRATAICLRDVGDEAFRQEIDFTDFPLPKISLYVENGTLLLQTEH